MALTLPDAATMMALAAASAAGQRRDWQQHHLLPRSLRRRAQIAQFLRQMGEDGPSLIDQSANLLWLPGTEALAAETGMSLHRGPHPRYDELVAARLERLRVADLPPAVAAARIGRLQQVLTKALSGDSGPALILNRHDPMQLFADYAALDEAIAAMVK
jgi:hypothetical protein